MLKTVFGGLDRVGALMLERDSRQAGAHSAARRLRPLPTCEFDYEYYGALKPARRGL